MPRPRRIALGIQKSTYNQQLLLSQWLNLSFPSENRRDLPDKTRGIGLTRDEQLNILT